MKECGMEGFYHYSGNFLGGEGVNQPVSSPGHIPYLEALIGAMHLFEGAARCRRWVVGTVIP
ncbi:MAG: hypothetical protein IKR86_08320 [Candidatus Methanomethylophilaceae archaeon]|nr:hypothetical protein [Candidatus Methanomethylophilaceae archaeon]